jgi:hypothetical protein
VVTISRGATVRLSAPSQATYLYLSENQGPKIRGSPNYQEFTGPFSGIAVGAYTCPIPAQNKESFTIMLGLDRIVSRGGLLQIQRGA